MSDFNRSPGTASTQISPGRSTAEAPLKLKTTWSMSWTFFQAVSPTAVILNFSLPITSVSDAAGAVADAGTAARLAEPGGSAEDHLRRHDAYPFFDRVGGPRR